MAVLVHLIHLLLISETIGNLAVQAIRAGLVTPFT